MGATKYISQVSEVISDALDRKGITQRQLAVKIGCTSEHIRKLVNGETVPAEDILVVICKELGLNPRETEKIAFRDRLYEKHGDRISELLGKNPELEPIDRVWPAMSEEHKADTISIVRAYAQRDKAAKKEKSDA